MAYVSNKYIRERAQHTVNHNLGRVIMLHLALWLVPALLLLRFLLADFFPQCITLLLGNFSFTGYSPSDAEAISVVFQFLGSILTYGLLACIVSCLLQPGFLYGLQELDRGVPVKGGVLLSRWKHVLGSIGLTLWIGVKLLAWALPGLLLNQLSTGMAGAMTGGWQLIGIIADILTLALVIPASYRYALAIHIFADTPEIGVFDAVERSKQIMSYRKWQLFCLTVPYELGIVGIQIVLMICKPILPAAGTNVWVDWLVMLVILAALAGTIYLSFLSTMAVACYYNAHKPQPVQEPAAPAEQPAAPAEQPAEATE